MFAVRVLAQRVDMWADTLKQHLAMSGVGNVNHLLNDVVGKLVFHHGEQRTLWPAQFTNTQLMHPLYVQWFAKPRDSNTVRL